MATWQHALNIKLQASYAGVTATAQYQLDPEDLSGIDDEDLMRWAREQGEQLSLSVLKGLNPTPPTPHGDTPHTPRPALHGCCLG